MLRRLGLLLCVFLLITSCAEREGDLPPPPPKRPDTVDARRMILAARERLAADLEPGALSWPAFHALLIAAGLDGGVAPPLLEHEAYRLVDSLPRRPSPQLCAAALPALLLWYDVGVDADAASSGVARLLSGLAHALPLGVSRADVSPGDLAAAAACLPHLVAWHGASADSSALDLAARIAGLLEGVGPGRGMPVTSHTRAWAGYVAAARRLQAGDEGAAFSMARAALADWRRAGLVTDWGMVADERSARSASATAALALLYAELGDWERAERSLRNHLAETLPAAGADDAAEAMIDLQRVLRRSVEPDAAGVTVHTLMNVSTPHVEVNCFLPYKGHIDVYVGHPGLLRLRCPSWVDCENVWATVNRIPMTEGVREGYWCFEGLRGGDRVSLTFTPPESSEEVVTALGRFTVSWKGATLLSLDPALSGLYEGRVYEGNPSFYER